MGAVKIGMLVSFMSIFKMAFAADYYVDPVGGKDGSLGVASSPVQSMSGLLNSSRITGGDRIILRRGHHGSTIVSKRNTSKVLVQAEAGATAGSLTFVGGSNWHFQGLAISGVNMDEMASDNTIENCYVGATNTNGVSSSSPTVTGGFRVSGSNNTFRGLHINNGQGIYIDYGANNNKIIACLIENMTSDGIHTRGGGTIIEYNTVRNTRKVNDNHNDLIQAYGSGGKIRFNKLRAYTDPKLPLIDRAVQGIGMFDGVMKNWVIEGNDIRVDNPIGIWCHGAENFTVINNRVGLIGSPTHGARWLPSITVNNSKYGKPAKNCTVTGNMAPTYRWNKEGMSSVGIVHSNIISKNPPLVGGGPIIPPTDTQAPSVSKLSGTAQSSNTIHLSWTAATDNVGVVGYEILRGTTLLTTVTGTTYSNTGLAAATTYTYTVKAKDAAGNRSTSNVVTVTTLSHSVVPDTQAPSIPVLRSPSQSSSTISLSWTASTDNVGVVGYEVLRGTTLLGTVTGSTFTSTGLAASTLYTYTVKAKDAAGNKSVSAALSVSTTKAGGTSYFKGINLNGPDLTIEGKAWSSYTSAKAAGLSISTSVAESQPQYLANSPQATFTAASGGSTDAATKSMLNSFVVADTTFTINQTLPNGTYNVYLWTRENYESNFRSFDVKLENSVVATGIGQLNKGTWKKYGPYTRSVTDGVLNIQFTATKGDPLVSGLVIMGN